MFQIFDVIEGAQGSISAAHNFESAHHDGLEALSMLGNSVYSAARDHSIRRWDLSTKQLKQVPILGIKQNLNLYGTVY